MPTLNDEIVDFLKTAPISEADRIKLTTKAKIRVDKKLVADIDAALTSAYAKLSEKDPEGAAMAEEIDNETETELKENWDNFEDQAEAIEKDEEDAYRKTTQEIDRASLEELKKEIKS